MAINGHQFAWEDMSVIIEGQSNATVGIVEINYEKKKKHENIYSKGADPTHAGRGSNEYSGNMVLLQSEVDRWTESLGPGKDITDLKGFGITINYGDGISEDVTDQLVYVRVESFKKGMKTGDGYQTIDLSLVIGKIKYNI